MVPQLMTVKTTLPLMVAADGNPKPFPAKVVSRGDTYVPAIGARVLVVTASDGLLYVIGGV